MKHAVLAISLLVLTACGPGDRQPEQATHDPAPAAAAANDAASAKAAAEAFIFDVRDIAGRNQEDVEVRLGKPTSCEKSKYGPKCFYATGEAEVIFIDGKADWITIEALDDAPYDRSTVTRFGLPVEDPRHENGEAIRWDGLGGMHSVSLFPGEAGKADYAYIKARTE